MGDMTTDTDSPVIEVPKAFVKYERKNTASPDWPSASVMIPVELKDGLTPEALADIDQALLDAKVSVLTVLDVPFTVTDGKIVEATPTPAAAPARAAAPAAAGTPPARSNVPCGVCGGPTFDNTKGPKPGNGKGPDFKCKDRANCGAAMWLNKDGSDGDWKS